MHTVHMILETKSPFPGCDPYLQRRWESCHTQMVVAFGELLRGKLPSDLRPRIESRVFIEETDASGFARSSFVKPDAFVVEYPRGYPPPRVETSRVSEGSDEGDTLVADPIEFATVPVEMKEHYINIVDVTDGERIITSIEILSPANKAAGPGFDRFRKKQDTMRAGGVSLVEIDLIRGGLRAISVPAIFKDAGPEILYRVAVLPAWRPGSGELYALTLRHRLPVINLPLRRTDPTLSLDLQAMHDIAYDRGEFAVDVDYRKEPEPPLGTEDAAWSDRLLKAKRLR